MTKKILSVVTTAAVLGTMACASAVSASAFSGEINFEIPDNWANANKNFYAHIWDGLPGGEGLYSWQTNYEKMTIANDRKTATYNVPNGEWNLIIISGDSGIQTYDSVFNANCIGDTCYVMDNKFENPVDSKKESYGLGWRNNSDCGPHKVVSSIGNVIGTAFLPGETNQTLYDNFVKVYNPENGIYNWTWKDGGATITGMTWKEVTAKVAKELGVSSSTDPTPAPTDPTPAPTNPTSAPTDSTLAPTDPTPAPTNPTLVPTDPTPVPTNPTPTPTKPATPDNVIDNKNGGSSSSGDSTIGKDGKGVVATGGVPFVAAGALATVALGAWVAMLARRKFINK